MHIIRITFKGGESDSRQRRLAFNIRIALDQIKKKNFINIQVYFKCYQIEKHTTQNCTNEKRVCSECANSIILRKNVTLE